MLSSFNAVFCCRHNIELYYQFIASVKGETCCIVCVHCCALCAISQVPSFVHLMEKITPIPFSLSKILITPPTS